MIHGIPFRFAVNLTLGVLGAVLLFHPLVLAGVIPYTVVWGGRLQSHEQMLVFESAALLVNGVLLAVVLAKGGYAFRRWPGGIVNGILWSMAGLFFLNTIGNLLATNLSERLFATPLTLLLALCCWRMAREKHPADD